MKYAILCIRYAKSFQNFSNQFLLFNTPVDHSDGEMFDFAGREVLHRHSYKRIPSEADISTQTRSNKIPNAVVPLSGENTQKVFKVVCQ